MGLILKQLQKMGSIVFFVEVHCMTMQHNLFSLKHTIGNLTFIFFFFDFSATTTTAAGAAVEKNNNMRNL